MVGFNLRLFFVIIYSMKVKKIFPIVAFLALFFFLAPSSVKADEQPAVENHVMGSYAGAEASQNQESNSVSDKEATDSNQPLKRQARSLLKDAPDNLNSNDNSLPRKDAVDIASYQSWMNQADFNALKAAGVKTIVVKLTEGTTYTNPYAKNQIQMARNAGLSIAAYHFVNDPTNIQNEAAYFARVANSMGLPKGTAMIEDAEYPSSAYNWTAVSQVFKKVLNAAGFGNVKYYSSQSWVGSGVLNASVLGAKNLWVAQYFYGSPSASNLKNTQYGAWQYSSQMYFQGTANLRANPVDVSIDYSNLFSINIPVVANGVYRLYNPNSGEHFYTMNNAEAVATAIAGWNYEGVGWLSTNSGGNPVYRLYNKNGGYHFYTMSSYERDSLIKKGWRNEGVSFHVGGNKKVYRAYNPHSGLHNYTMSSYEQNSIVKAGWRNEGTAWYSN